MGHMTLGQHIRSMRKTMRDMFGISRLRAGQEDMIRSVLVEASGCPSEWVNLRWTQ
jgi:hypothetical protein